MLCYEITNYWKFLICLFKSLYLENISVVYVDSIQPFLFQEPPQDKLDLSSKSKALKSSLPEVGSK